MKTEPANNGPIPRSKAEVWIVLLALAVVFWVARYLHFGSFGLYEDDLTIIPTAVQMSLPDLFQFIFVYITHLYGHARPLSDSFIYLFSNLGWRLGGLKGIYLLGYLIITTNLALFYLLLRRVSNPSLALLGGLAYALYSADTTQSFLTHSLGVHPSITLLLLAYHSYLSKQKILAYVLAFIILFSYETPFLVFLAAPLLSEKWDKKLIWKIGLHGAVLAGMLVAVFALRFSVGEGRVTGLSTQDVLIVPLTHMIQGPAVSLGTYLYRPYQAVTHLTIEIAAAICVAFPLLILLLTRFGQEAAAPVQIPDEHGRPKSGLRSLPPERQQLGKLVITGIVMLAMAYPLTFTVSAVAVTGRDTRVHTAGAVGAALLFACAGAALLWAFQRVRKAAWGRILLSGLLALLVGYGLLLQQDYANAWKYQQQFWSELLPLIPDATENTVILVDFHGLPNSRQIGANTWNLPRTLNQIFTFPKSWKNPPRVYRLTPYWSQYITMDEGPLQFYVDAYTTMTPDSLGTQISPSHVILIGSDSGHLDRQPSYGSVSGPIFPLKPVTTPVLPGLTKGFLYPFLIQK